ncbi:MAG: hypothetical protein HC857_09955 [Synechococcales cyanobacterium RU_4_20]|nr:hypothetical protein [Synechococcales cyanobacterium RU_4_20]
MATPEATGPAEDFSKPGLVSLGGKLPHFLELRTAAVLDCLQALTPKATGKANRTRLRASLASRTRIGMYLEMSANLHLAYAGQPDGRGSQHYWRLFYTDELRPVIEAAINGRSHSSATGQRRNDAAHVGQGAPAIAGAGCISDPSRRSRSPRFAPHQHHQKRARPP